METSSALAAAEEITFNTKLHRKFTEPKTYLIIPINFPI